LKPNGRHTLSTSVVSNDFVSPDRPIHNAFAATTSQGFIKKTRAYPYRMKATKHLELTMNEALQRYEKQLKDEEDRKLKLVQHFRKRVE